MGGYGCKKYLAVFVGPAHFIVFIAPVARLRFMTTRGTCHCAAAPPSSREASHFRGVFQVRLLPRDFEKSIRHACHFQVKEFYRDSLRHKTPLSLFIHSSGLILQISTYLSHGTSAPGKGRAPDTASPRVSVSFLGSMLASCESAVNVNRRRHRGLTHEKPSRAARASAAVRCQERVGSDPCGVRGGRPSIPALLARRGRSAAVHRTLLCKEVATAAWRPYRLCQPEHERHAMGCGAAMWHAITMRRWSECQRPILQTSYSQSLAASGIDEAPSPRKWSAFCVDQVGGWRHVQGAVGSRGA